MINYNGLRPIVNTANTGKNIRTLRKRNRLSVETLQDILGVGSAQAIYNWEAGKNMPSIDNLLVLSALFGVSIEEIVAVDNIDVRRHCPIAS